MTAALSPAVSRRSLLLTGSTVVVALAGCVIAPLPPGRGGAYPTAPEPGPEVDIAPPPPQADPMSPSPGAAYVWIGGYWSWHLGRHVWVGGRWALPPAGHAWVPGRWVAYGNRWRWHGGHWARR